MLTVMIHSTAFALLGSLAHFVLFKPTSALTARVSMVAPAVIPIEDSRVPALLGGAEISANIPTQLLPSFSHVNLGIIPTFWRVLEL